jgi:hypothetical protein
MLAKLRAFLRIESTYDAVVAVLGVLMVLIAFVLYIQHDQHWQLLWPGFLLLGAFIGFGEAFTAWRRGDRRASLGLFLWNISAVIFAPVLVVVLWDVHFLAWLPESILTILIGTMFVLQALGLYLTRGFRGRNSSPTVGRQVVHDPSPRKMPPVF